jgi:hypothetical protein
MKDFSNSTLSTAVVMRELPTLANKSKKKTQNKYNDRKIPSCLSRHPPPKWFPASSASFEKRSKQSAMVASCVPRNLNLFSLYSTVITTLYIVITACIVISIKYMEPIRSVYNGRHDSSSNWKFSKASGLFGWCCSYNRSEDATDDKRDGIVFELSSSSATDPSSGDNPMRNGGLDEPLLIAQWEDEQNSPDDLRRRAQDDPNVSSA